MAMAILGSIEHKEWWELGREHEMNAHKNLETYLRFYFGGGTDDLARLSIHCRETDALGGRLLHPVFVGRLEVDCALSRLRECDWLAEAVLRITLSVSKQPGTRSIAARLHQSPGDVTAAYQRGLNWLVDHIYDWTSGGQALAAEASRTRQETAERHKSEELQKLGRT